MGIGFIGFFFFFCGHGVGGILGILWDTRRFPIVNASSPFLSISISQPLDRSSVKYLSKFILGSRLAIHHPVSNIVYLAALLPCRCSLKLLIAAAQ